MENVPPRLWPLVRLFLKPVVWSLSMKTFVAFPVFKIFNICILRGEK